MKADRFTVSVVSGGHSDNPIQTLSVETHALKNLVMITQLGHFGDEKPLLIDRNNAIRLAQGLLSLYDDLDGQVDPDEHLAELDQIDATLQSISPERPQQEEWRIEHFPGGGGEGGLDSAADALDPHGEPEDQGGGA